MFIMLLVFMCLSEHEVREHLFIETHSIDHPERIKRAKIYLEKLVLVRHAAARLHLKSSDIRCSWGLYTDIRLVIEETKDFYIALKVSREDTVSVYFFVGFMTGVWRSYQMLEKISDCVICPEGPCMMRYSEHGL